MNKTEDKSGLVIKIVAIVLLILVVVGVILLFVFNKQKPHTDLDLEYVGKYELVELSGLVNQKTNEPITVADYEYNYIELKADGHYEIANGFIDKSKKNKVKKTSQKGVWYTKNDDIVFESSRMLGLVKTEDKGKISKADGTIIMTYTNDKNNTIRMVLKKK